jgi:hypothetical protein
MKNYFAHLKKIHAGRSPLRVITYIIVMFPGALLELVLVALDSLDEWYTEKVVDKVRDWALERKNEL